MLRKIALDNRKYITLDNPLMRDLAINDPSLFLQRYKPPILIDEIQYAPQLLPYIKMYVDEHKNKGDFWLTGSQMFHMMKNVSESLAGIVGVLNMLGLSFSEIIGRKNEPFSTEFNLLIKKDLIKDDVLKVYKRIYKGAMPGLYEVEHDLEKFYSSYINTYIQRDIKELTQVANELSFMRFLQACAARTAQMVNYSELANDVGISAPTAKQWLSILISCGIVTLIEPYFNNLLKRKVKAPNMYFLDTGLCAYLTRWTNPESLEISAMSGAFFETYVISEIIKSYINDGKRPPIYYYRDSDQKEIDLIINLNQKLYPIEIKKSGNPKKDAIKHFSVLNKTGLEIGAGNVICLCDDIVPIDKKNYFVPISLI